MSNIALIRWMTVLTALAIIAVLVFWRRRQDPDKEAA